MTQMELGLLVSFHFIISNGLFHQTCNYSGHLKPGTIYYVYNSDYPNVSNGRQYCRWFAESDYRIRLTCNNFNIPWNFKCTLDRLTVYVNDSLTRYYCGNEPFSIESTGTFMTIELSTPFWSSGVKFLCELQTIEEIVNNDDCCKCGWKKPTKIVGGMETGVNEYPMMAGLVDLFEKDVFCGATIISKKHVLTAAHCLIDTDPSTVNILVGDHDLTTGADTNASRLYTIAKFYMHPLYNIQPPQNDIAIVMVNSVISFNEEVGPACLPFQHQFDSFAGSNVVLLGWGLTNYSQMKSNVLQKVTVAVITNQECRKEYPTITNDHICTYTEGKDACQFDSGGPALWQNPTTKREVLVGIISGGMGCGGSNAGINTRVGAYIDWILSVTSGKVCLLPVWGPYNPRLLLRDAVLFRIIVRKCFGSRRVERS
ncbi:PREDICTED: venom serine protease 34-like [Cyphomyrmex costatus]|uniref:venom serine protease 34-like n=1 Tax=Cyphomyrmex costatus TaxID=456900 RepID=UPI00085238EC|nr:PREDICTED: venom serine protease 34-like [Cyphomyrmex costatus]